MIAERSQCSSSELNRLRSIAATFALRCFKSSIEVTRLSGREQISARANQNAATSSAASPSRERLYKGVILNEARRKAFFPHGGLARAQLKNL